MLSAAAASAADADAKLKDKYKLSPRELDMMIDGARDDGIAS